MNLQCQIGSSSFREEGYTKLAMVFPSTATGYKQAWLELVNVHSLDQCIVTRTVM